MRGKKLSDESPKERKGWNKRLLDALGNPKLMADASQQARNERMSAEFLSRPFRTSTDTSTKMAGAGDDT